MAGEATIFANRLREEESTHSIRRVAEGLHHSNISSFPSQALVPSGTEDPIVQNKANFRGTAALRETCCLW